MLSYREKQLLASMKYMQNKAGAFSDDLKKTLEQMEKGELLDEAEGIGYSEPARDMDELYQRAKEAGFDSWTRASDILTSEEMEDLKARKQSIEAEFKSKIKLRKEDYAFLIPATMLQIGKQIVLKLDLTPHEESASDAEKNFKNKYDRKNDIDGTEAAKRYYAPMQQITMTKTVPYDIVKGTKYFGDSDKKTNLGLSGNTHRFKSVGHDPILGLYFGTANILTNTATFYYDPEKITNEVLKYINYLGMVNYHIRYEDMNTYSKPYIASFASRIKLDERVLDRFKSEPSAFWAALGKEIGHIKSDQGSVAGIPIPFAAQLFGTQQAQDMASRGLDWDHLLTNLAVVGKQASFAILFNAIVAMLHRLYLIWDEVKAAGSPVDAVERYIKTDVSVYDDIRTKEIIMCSNI